MNKILTSKWTSWALVLGLAIALLLSIKQCSSNQQVAEAMESTVLEYHTKWENVIDTAEIYKNKAGILTAETEAMMITHETLLRENRNLENALMSSKGKIRSLTQIVTQTTVNQGSDSVDVTFPVDTVHDLANPRFFGDTVYITQPTYPLYKSQYSDEWINLNVTMNPDSMTFSLDATDQIILTSVRKRRWFKPDLHTVYVQSLSPYTSKIGANNYEIKEKPNLIDWGLILGYGITTSAKPDFFMGLGILVRPQYFLNK